MQSRSTISDDYLSQQRELHKNPNYGVASLGYAPLVKQILEQTGIKAISDYGAGKCNLRKGLNDLGLRGFEYFPYDPVFPEYGPPKAAPLVCCIDVLEHIEESYLDGVLLDLKDITKGIGFFSVHTGAAAKTLPDGRNAHIIQKPSSWWLPRLCEHFEIAQLQRSPGGFWVLAEPRAQI
ncbi:MAG: hypothetical protein FJX62_21925 [Alphaproteobacteria bacterium]|nr:hypothetical protein [Alphaproteobacteria bacterium]